MDMHRMMSRGAGALLVATLATALLAPAAEAGRRHRRVVRYEPVIERHSEAGAVFGFLGGLVLGTVIANAQAAPPVRERACEPDYDYYDPWCRESFGTLGRYEDHLDRHHHPRRAEVVDARSGRCVDTVRWYEGRWVADDERARVVGGDTPPYEEWDD